ncbi:hypothetical protein HOU00_gp104 [Caulobacter phage CcrPW]|uniref:Uncharacterized protein n=1 Tax=Caulobacter phage CcrPW TaxID=2283271 RepID=A0A385EAU5_9CAUD|nr:hypothetical protein HOU00_gp033 [Caulobacter phage CcrPW]YP_009809651.1 hypothetical protein HOU00_gp104 [Caulobacter phage CcrPW]AXQ68572.1 hypothetical protein CcrPW_gp033 [Caulobacter phage CcrPW]AXQ69021.1 hypothetical protein CcrPW_gp482 [Caulobacter phage CcrPW]
MSRSFRHSAAFEDTRAEFAARKNARESRRREFESMGFDNADALAVRRFHRPYKGRNRSVLDIEA